MNISTNIVGNKPPAMVPNKGVYMVKDIQRLGKYYGVPLKQPKVCAFLSKVTGMLEHILPVQKTPCVDLCIVKYHPNYSGDLS